VSNIFILIKNEKIRLFHVRCLDFVSLSFLFYFKIRVLSITSACCLQYIHRGRVDEHKQCAGLKHDGHTVVLGPAMVRPLSVAGLDGWRPAEVGDRQPVLQLRVHGRERGRAKRCGRRRRVQNARTVRRLVPRRSDGSHGGVDGERLERRGCGRSAIVFRRTVVGTRNYRRL